MNEELLPWLMIGYLLLAMIGGFICFLWIVGIGFSEGVLQGLGCLLCGPYGFYFCVTRWQRCKAPFLISLALNIGMVFVQFQSVDGRSMEDLFAAVQRYQVAARESEGERIARDMRTLQGLWRLKIAHQSNGADQFETFEFDGDRCIVRGRGVEHHFEFLLSKSALGKMIDLTNTESGEQLQGIYVLRGDRFTLCVASPGGARPDRFVTWGNQQRSFELERESSHAHQEDEQNAQLAPQPAGVES